MKSAVEEFAADILSAEGPDAAWDIATSFFEAYGFAGCVYGQRPSDRDPTGTDIKFSNGLEKWQEAYFAHRDHERDPLFLYAPQLSAMFFTGVAFLDDHPYLDDEDLAVIRRADDFGLTAGIAFRMSGSTDQTVRGWHLVSRFSRPEIEALHRNHGIVLQICAALADQKISKIINPPDAGLTKREKECLSLLAMGNRTGQIAQILSIKPVTVDMHIRNIRDKFGARTREQALAIAIATDQISI